MDAQTSTRARAVFDDLVGRPPADRAAALAAACGGGDQQLRAEVESLLAAHDAAGRFLAEPTMDETRDDPHPAGGGEGPGRRVGRYKLLQLIGEGGFGTVFMAEQVEPVRRRVALKVIKLGMDTKQVVARFEAERQALAMMDHPNIARVLDGGATESGRPYFVMELVRGVPVTDYCDQHNLTTRERAALFVQVCQAVQHAHQKGIIHRDLKPTNVLVTEQDGRPVPKVIDFGVAKATDQRLTERTLFTEHRQMVGTPAYMSPEQAGVTAADVDTRSDVYSLGVLLYELLTGTTPFDARELRSKAYAEVQRIIREVDPPRPSTRLSTLGGALPSVAARRRAEPAKLGRLVRGELDWIVMRCLEKDRARRYESASGLALDLQRHLDDEPVAARPPTAGYRARKFARRHTGLLAGAAAVVLTLAVGLAAALAGLRAARRAEAREGSARVDAQRSADAERTSAAAARVEADKVRAINRFLSDMFRSANPTRFDGPQLTVKSAVEAAGRKLDQGALKGQPAVEAAVRLTLAEACDLLFMGAEAEAHLQAALRLREQVYGPDSDEVAQVYPRLAWLRYRKGDRVGNEAYHRRAMDLWVKRHGPDSAEAARGYGHVAVALVPLHRYDEADRLLQRALGIFRRVHGPGSRDEAGILTAVGELHTARRELRAAVGALRRAIAIAEAVLPPPPADAAPGVDLVEHARLELAPLLAPAGLYDEAVEVRIGLLAAAARREGPDHLLTAVHRHELAAALCDLGRYDEAEPEVVRALEAARQGARSGKDTYVENWTRTLADIRHARGDVDGAARLYQEVLAGYVAQFNGDGHDGVVGVLQDLARVARDRGRPDDADAHLRRARAAQAALAAREPASAGHQGVLAELHLLTGDLPAAAAAYDRAVGLTRGMGPRGRAAHLCLLRGDRDGYERLRRDILDRFGGDEPPVGRFAVALVALAAPLPPSDLAGVRLMLDANAADPAAHWLRRDGRVASAAAAYRAGRPVAAVEALAAARRDARGPYMAGLADAYLTMALKDAERPDEEVRAALAAAASAARDPAPAVRGSERDARGTVVGWLALQVAYREAHRRVVGTDPPPVLGRPTTEPATWPAAPRPQPDEGRSATTRPSTRRSDPSP